MDGHEQRLIIAMASEILVARYLFAALVHFPTLIMPTKPIKTPGKQRGRLTLGQQVQLCHVAAVGKATYTALAAWATVELDLLVPLSRKAVARILRDREKVMACSEACFVYKDVVNMDVRAFEEAVAAKIDVMEQHIEIVSGYIVIELARDIAERVRLPPR